MTTFKTFSVIAAMLLSSTFVFAQNFEVNGINYNVTSQADKTVEVAPWGKYSGNITIPANVTYEGISYTVTAIGRNAFGSRSDLTNVEIPNSVTKIDTEAFYNCNKLTSIDLPDNLTSIGKSAFEYCDDLTTIEIPNSVRTIGDNAFAYLINLTSVHVSDTASWCKIAFGNLHANPLYSAKHLFVNNSELTDLVIPEEIDIINDYAFSGCDGLTSITIPEHIKNIGKGAFDGCGELTSINVAKENSTYDSRNNCNALIESSTNTLLLGCRNTIIPNSIVNIGESAFAECTGLNSIVIPNSVESIGNYAFVGCDLVSVEIPNSVTKLGTAAFSSCPNLTSINIPNSITSIGEMTFIMCWNLKDVVLGKNVKEIGNAAFAACGISKITCHAQTPPTCGDEVFDSTDIQNCKLLVPENSISLYKEADQWKNFVLIENIPSAIDGVGVNSSDKYKSTTVFNIRGIKMQNTDNLPKGIYIKNGKKYHVK